MSDLILSMQTREALGALTQAIKNFAGGVIIISHNAEFTDALCTEKWVVKDGTVFVKGEIDAVEEKKVFACIWCDVI